VALTVTVIDEAGTVVESWQVEPDKARQDYREDYGDPSAVVLHLADGITAGEL
jgi:hypothetical protein